MLPDKNPSSAPGPMLLVASGPAEIDGAAHAAVVWMVLRGEVRVRAREGHFLLGAGDWLALDGDSTPGAIAARGTLVLGAHLRAGERAALLPGRGRMARGERVRALRIWRRGGAGALDFIEALQGDLLAGTDRCPGHSRRRRRQVLLRMQRARLCLEGHLGEGLPIADVARRSNFSPWYFSKVFHAVYGMRPRQYAARMRLEHASRLLATTSLPVIEVSAACGFDNPCSFARAFRARFGMTASEHRQRRAR